MMKKMQKWLLALALVMLIGATIRPAVSYFTTYVHAIGDTIIFLGDSTEIKEEYDEKTATKSLVVSNVPDSEADRQLTMFVRARGFAGGAFELTYAGADWTGPDADGFYYYKNALAPGQDTTALDVSIKIPKDAQTDEWVPFEVTVVYEAVPVMYEEDGKTLKAYDDPEVWSQEVIEVTQEGGN